VEKYCTAGQATDENIARAHYVLDTYGKTHTHTEYVTLIVNKQTYKNMPSNTRHVLSHNASCFGSHEPSSGISHFFLQELKKKTYD